MKNDRTDVDRCLDEWKAGNPQARERLVPLIYTELRALAGSLMKRERSTHTLQPTALAHEALLRLCEQHSPSARGKQELMGLLAELMRRVLVDHARRKQALRRGGDRTIVTLAEDLEEGSGPSVDLIDLDFALSKLAKLDARQARGVELRLFGGLDVAEVAAALGISSATVKREWRTAKVWLAHELKR